MTVLIVPSRGHSQLHARRCLRTELLKGAGMMRPSKAGQSCWTCKQRKIGCDRTLPLCGNCTRSGRECQGYNIRLLWPDRPDGRRKVGEVVHCPGNSPGPLPKHYGQQFINVTFDDVRESSLDETNVLRELVTKGKLKGQMSIEHPRKGLFMHHAFVGQDGNLLSYYEKKIATMISTTQTPNGFQSELLPMAFSTSTPSTLALTNAMLAVAAHHHQGPEAALHYKSLAVRALSDSLRRSSTTSLSFDPNSPFSPFSPDAFPPPSPTLEDHEIDTQISASMMLCVYSVFDETEGNWHLHLDGARFMLQKLVVEQNRPLQSGFLVTWFLYHEVLACFTHPLREDLRYLDVLSLIERTSIDTTVIVGSLGCSTEIIEIIQRINRIRATLLLNPSPSPGLHHLLTQTRQNLLNRLQTLEQHLPAASSPPHITPAETQIRILTTAELYRLAATLYLLRVLPYADDQQLRASLLNVSLAALEALDVATSPWPLFVVACEAACCDDDSARVQVLAVLDRMERVRGIGNLRVMRSIVEGFWKQLDLRADSAANGGAHSTNRSEGVNMRWWDMVNTDPAVPWFI